MSTSTHPNPEPRRTVHRLVDLAWLSAIAVAAWFLWPASLGGHTRLIAVEGRSMEPTYHLGDAVIARDNPNPKMGDVIVYHIPKGQPAAGLLIIHRVSGLWPDGTYQTQGDNRTSPDPFHIVSGDIIGTPELTPPPLRPVHRTVKLARGNRRQLRPRRHIHAVAHQGEEPQ